MKAKHRHHAIAPYKLLHVSNVSAVCEYARLTRTHEASQPVAWKMTDAPKDYIDSMLKLIVGIEIEITRIEGKSKLSQNKEHRDIAGAAHALNASRHRVIAQAMQAIADKKTNLTER